MRIRRVVTVPLLLEFAVLRLAAQAQSGLRLRGLWFRLSQA